jgi:hypothetical protein
VPPFEALVRVVVVSEKGPVREHSGGAKVAFRPLLFGKKYAHPSQLTEE